MPTDRASIDDLRLAVRDALDGDPYAGYQFSVDTDHYRVCGRTINRCTDQFHLNAFLAWHDERAEQHRAERTPDLNGPRDHRLKPVAERDFPCCDQRSDDDLSGWDRDYRRVDSVDGLTSSTWPVERVIIVGLPATARIASRVGYADGRECRYVVIDVAWPGADG